MKLRSASLTPLKTIPVAGIFVVLLLVGCAETRLALHAVKKLSHEPENPIGTYKVGKPYRVGDVWYRPYVDYAYRETGIASWYGPKFHNQRTANGQIFNMNSISAAHRTLPLPSVVRVTNLENGRSLKVLVNDRGPFAHGRIIDLSRRAAQLLGFERTGTARVQVSIVADESRRLARLALQNPSTDLAVARPLAQARNTGMAAARPLAQVRNTDMAAAMPSARVRRTDMAAAMPSVPVKVASLPAEETADVRIMPVSGKTALFVQAGAFSRKELAMKMKRDLTPIGPTQIVEAMVGERLFYRVRLGPLATVNDGDRILDAVMRTGYPDARLVVY